MMYTECDSSFRIFPYLMTISVLSRSVLFEGTICLYWFLFWLMNGLDKFLNGRDLVLFTWIGKDRTTQFGTYFNGADLPTRWINPVLHAIGIWEIATSLFFLAAISFCFRKNAERKFQDTVVLGFMGGSLAFTGFSAFDIIAGVRLELFEHGIYLGMIILSWFVIMYRANAKSPGEGE